MKTILHLEPPVEIEVQLPILVREAGIGPCRNIQPGDYGRLYLLNSREDRRARLDLLGPVPRNERQRELALLANPRGKTPLGADEIYLGRYEVVDLNKCNGDVELDPRLEMPLVWHRCLDPEEMLSLAHHAMVDFRKLYAAAAACARLVVHAADVYPEALQMLEAVEAWIRGEISDDDFEFAAFEYRVQLADAPWFARHQGTSKCFAALAAECDLSSVLDQVVEAAIESRDENGMALQCDRASVTHILGAACANLIRGVIRIEDNSALAEAIAHRNEALCRLPCVDFEKLRSSWFSPVETEIVVS